MDICRDWYELNKSKLTTITNMILVDLNQVMISNLMDPQNKGNLSELPSKDTVRHSILNTIRTIQRKV